jgi:hypothetical protein
VHVLQREATVEEIANIVAIAVVDAQESTPQPQGLTHFEESETTVAAR